MVAQFLTKIAKISAAVIESNNIIYSLIQYWLQENVAFLGEEETPKQNWTYPSWLIYASGREYCLYLVTSSSVGCIPDW